MLPLTSWDQNLERVRSADYPKDWWRDVEFREQLRASENPDYMLARLERDRALYAASGGWTWTNDDARAIVKYLRDQTESARGPFDELVDTSPVIFRRRKLRAVTAFVEAVVAEIREYEGMISDPLLGAGGDPDDEREMEQLLERYERAARGEICPVCETPITPGATECDVCGEELTTESALPGS